MHAMQCAAYCHRNNCKHDDELLSAICLFPLQLIVLAD